MKKDESDLKAKLVKAFRAELPNFICQRIEDRITSGWPDIEIIGRARTSYIEVKHATPNFVTSGIQELTMLRLANASFYARYVIFEERRGVRRTLIVHPKNLEPLQPEAFIIGFQFGWVVDKIREMHGV